MKTCSICNQRKSDSDYYRTREGTTYGPCKVCRRESANARHEERRREAQTSYERLAGLA
jgi:hypothetical protein